MPLDQMPEDRVKVKRWWFYFYLTPCFLIQAYFAYHARAAGEAALYTIATVASLTLGLYSLRTRKL